MREVILYIAMSLDGFIAGDHDDLSFLDGYDTYQLPQQAYQTLTEEIDTIIMGRKTYTWLLHHTDTWPYPHYDTYVISRQLHKHQDKITFRNDCVSLIKSLKKSSGKHIWLVGGSEIIDILMKEQLIDQYIITIIPKILGSGIPLFKNRHEIMLDLVDHKHEKDLIMITYRPKK